MLIFGLLVAFGAFQLTKKKYHNRVLSYALSGAAAFVILPISMLRQGYSLIAMIISLALVAVTTLAFVIGEKRALSSGKHTGDFEKDRAAREFKPFTFKQAMQKWPYPFLKDKNIVNNIIFKHKFDFISEDNPEYRPNVAGIKLSLLLIHGLFIFLWCLIVGIIWFFYFLISLYYWMFAALIDTYKDLYTHEGSEFSFRESVSEIVNSDEVINGISNIKTAAQNVGGVVKNATDSVMSVEMKERINAVKNGAKNLTEKSKNVDNEAASNNQKSFTKINENTFSNNAEKTHIDTGNTSYTEASGVAYDTIMAEQEAETFENTSTPESVISDDTDAVVLPDSPLLEETNSTPQADTDIHDTISQSYEHSPMQRSNYTAATQNTDNHGTYSQAHDTSYQRQNTPPPMQYQNYSPEPQNNFNTPPPVQSQSGFQRISEPKKSNTVAILLAIIAALLLGIVVIGLLFLTKEKNPKPTNDNSVSAVITTEVSSVNEETTVETTEEKAETTEKTDNNSSVSDEEFNADVEKFLNSLVSDSSDPIKNAKYALFDVNDDGVKELFFTAEHMAGIYTTMYLYDNNTFNATDVTGENVKICTNESLIECDRFGGGAVYTYYNISGNTIKLADKLYSYAGQYYHGDAIITESEFNSLLAEKNKLSWLEPSFTDYTPKNQGIANSGSNSIDYHSDHRSGAGSDFVFAENDGAGGLIATESDALNLRAKPDVNAEIIAKMPKDSSVGIFGSNSDWYYIHYTENGTSYYGYASRQYVRNLQVEAKTGIVPIEQYGTIYSPSGAKVDGYARSYIIDGGPESYIRHDLTHGWHIKAVNKYNTNTVEWYELYDADDGDYYGWVSNQSISFY